MEKFLIILNFSPLGFIGVIFMSLKNNKEKRERKIVENEE